MSEDEVFGIMLLAVITSFLGFGVGLVFLSFLQAVGCGFIGFALGFFGFLVPVIIREKRK